jgi:hypothetical protein
VSAVSPILLAHQGGWDEILLIGGPIVIIVLLLRLAKKRVDASVGDGAEQPTDQPTGQSPT